MYYTTTYLSPVGPLLIASDSKSITGLWLEKQKYFGYKTKEEMIEKDNLPVFTDTKKWLECYFAGGKPAISILPLAPLGSEFRRAVWDILCEIPYGEVTTYGNIAKKIAVKKGTTTMSAQAVGGAVGRNPISIIIPCHRVIGANGSLTGYAGGIAKKIQLLEHEGVDMSGMFIPAKGTAL